MIFSFCIALLICLGFVFLSVSAECRHTIRLNFRRIDGSWSPNRFRREVKAIREYVLSIFAPLLIVFLTAFAVSSFFCQYLIPHNLIVDGFEAFDWNPSKWKDNLAEVRQDHSAFAKSKGMSAKETTQLQKSLWTSIPAMIGMGMLLVVASIVVVFRSAKVAVTEWAAGIRCRRSQYARGDVHRMQSGTLAGHRQVQ